MATNCKHHVTNVDDETLLLDNDISKECTKCIVESDYLWSDCEVTQAHEENSDSAEDSPLLIEVVTRICI